MPDVIFVGLIVLFFAAVVLLVKRLEGLYAANAVALAIAIALVGYLLGALLFPEKF